MKFKVVDQLDKFAFRDVEVSKVELVDGKLHLTMGGVISKYNNPCNERFQDWYILEAYARLEGAELIGCYKEGPTYYDADGKVLQDVPDEPVPVAEYETTLKLFQNSILFTMLEKESMEGKKHLELAFDTEGGEGDTYWLEVVYDRMIIEWDRYANKVMEN